MNNLDIAHSTARYLKYEFTNCDSRYTKVFGNMFRTFLEEMSKKYKNTKVKRFSTEYSIYEIYCHSGVIIYRFSDGSRFLRGEFEIVES